MPFCHLPCLTNSTVKEVSVPKRGGAIQPSTTWVGAYWVTVGDSPTHRDHGSQIFRPRRVYRFQSQCDFLLFGQKVGGFFVEWEKGTSLSSGCQFRGPVTTKHRLSLKLREENSLSRFLSLVPNYWHIIRVSDIRGEFRGCKY